MKIKNLDTLHRKQAELEQTLKASEFNLKNLTKHTFSLTTVKNEVLHQVGMYKSTSSDGPTKGDFKSIAKSFLAVAISSFVKRMTSK